MDYFIFDMDGTIFDTEKFYYQTWLDIAKKEGFIFGLEDKVRLSGKQSDESIAYMVENFSMDEKEAIRIRKNLNELRDKKFNELDYSLKKPGLLNLLLYLRENNKNIALASSSIKSIIDFLLDREGVRDYFDEVISSDDIKKGKPDPQIFNLAMEKIGADKNKTYIIEDSLAGVKAAKKSGAKVVLIIDLDESELIKSQADLVFSSLDEFLSYIKNNEKIDTRNKDFKLSCPSCGKNFTKTLPTAVFSINDKDFLENIGLIECPSCKKIFKLNYRYVYTDNDKKLMFVNDPKFSQKRNQLAFKSSLKLLDKFNKNKASDFLIRMCQDDQDLKEKISIFNDGKIDNIVEIMKLVLMQSPDFKFNNDDILKIYYKDNEFIINSKEGKFKMPFISDLYESLYEKYIPFIDIKNTEVIDQNWARKIVKEI
ncbi:HAD-IA family hydrolase [Anaerococcus hydrogenalis]|uniref:HAD-IA family hydrolase n=1 Tax=Anaerococcus hydrogenalis TaxID=33029 RepID=UPI0029028DE3|nr:HAD-IA family hydrolase [Anaerococcus hydrogenalis]MDU1316121.1 HAD-IA family hydrolase [Anaerococcus hydrogenalis]